MNIPFRLVIACYCLFFVPSLVFGENQSEVEVGTSYESLSKGHSSWRSAYIEAVVKAETGDIYYGNVRRTERFSLLDTELSAGIYRSLGEKKTLNVEMSASPSHNVLPSLSASASLHHALDNAWGIQGGGRYRRYTNSATYSGNLLIEKYILNFRSHITLSSSHASGAGSSSAIAVGTDYYYGNKNKVGLIYADGKEVESLGNARVLTTKVQSLTLLGRHWVSNKMALSYEVLSHEQGKNYTRYGIRLGLRRSF
jgi:YaiO family outer membrane protein